MKRSSLLALAMALLLTVAVVPLVLAADEPAPVEPTPSAEPTQTPDDGNGEIVIDPTFITETAAPAASPRGEVRGATGRPDRTPPATDTIAAEIAPGTGLQVLFLVAIAGCSLALLAARVPPARRS